MREVGAVSGVDFAVCAAIPHERTPDAGNSIEKVQVFTLIPLYVHRNSAKTSFYVWRGGSQSGALSSNELLKGHRPVETVAATAQGVAATAPATTVAATALPATAYNKGGLSSRAYSRYFVFTLERRYQLRYVLICERTPGYVT